MPKKDTIITFSVKNQQHKTTSIKILVIGNKLLGDTLCAYGFLYSAFCYLFKTERLKITEWHLLTNAYTALLYQQMGFFAKTFFYDNNTYIKKSTDEKRKTTLKKFLQDYANYIALYKKLKKEKYDVAFVLPGGFGFALLTFLLRIPFRLGHKSDYRTFLLTHSHSLQPNIPNKENYLQLLKLLPKIKVFKDIAKKHQQKDVVIRNYAMKYGAPATTNIGKTKIDASLPPHQHYYIVAANSSEDNHMWQANHFIDLCNLITTFCQKNNLTSFTPLLLGTKSEQKDLDAIANRCSAMNVAGRFSLYESAYLVKHALFYVGLDTGLAHIAANVKTTNFIIYGPSNIRLSQPITDAEHLACKQKGKPLFYAIYNQKVDIPLHQRKLKKWQRQTDINLVTPQQVFDVIQSTGILSNENQAS